MSTFLRDVKNAIWHSAKTEYPNGKMVTIIQPMRGLEWEIQGLAEEYLKTHRITNYHIFKHDVANKREEEVSSFSVCSAGQIFSFENQLHAFYTELSSQSERNMTREMVALMKRTMTDLQALKEQFEKEYNTLIFRDFKENRLN